MWRSKALWLARKAAKYEFASRRTKSDDYLIEFNSSERDNRPATVVTHSRHEPGRANATGIVVKAVLGVAQIEGPDV
jgi:hypothetical protein